jgi:hypothetical protein
VLICAVDLCCCVGPSLCAKPVQHHFVQQAGMFQPGTLAGGLQGYITLPWGRCMLAAPAPDTPRR